MSLVWMEHIDFFAVYGDMRFRRRERDHAVGGRLFGCERIAQKLSQKRYALAVGGFELRRRQTDLVAGQHPVQMFNVGQPVIVQKPFEKIVAELDSLSRKEILEKLASVSQQCGGILAQ